MVSFLKYAGMGTDMLNTLTTDQLVAGLRTATVAGRLFPLLCASGLSTIGIQPLLDAMVALAPSAAERGFFAADGVPPIVPDERDGCTINGAVMSLAKGTADLLAIAEGRHHVG